MKKYIGLGLVVLVLLFLTVGVFLSLTDKDNKEEKESLAGMDFQLELKKENILSLISGAENGIKIPDAFLKKALPDLVSVSGKISFADGKAELIGLKVNGSDIPCGALTNIIENFLDFECSLVYN